VTELSALGLNPDEEAVYRSLVDRPSATAADLARTLRHPPDTVRGCLAALEERGLVGRAGGTRTRFVAAPPAISLGPLITRQRDDLRRAELELLALTERYRTAAGARTAGDLVEVVTGVDTLARRFTQLQQGATEELLTMVTAQTVAVTRQDNSPAEEESVRRGVRYRVILERAVLEQPGATADATAAIQSGEELRVVEQVPTKLAIADRTLAMLPLTTNPTAPPAAIVIHRSGLLHALVSLFEATWTHALSLRANLSTTSPDPTLADLDQKIVTLLLAGLTDRSIATQLQLSMRTVQRRVRTLMDTANVRTRLQLGWQLARTGWL
jgi:sugar-specific transcriptional regulator TrmB/DNA-binding CsgD family transcriptional regulator